MLQTFRQKVSQELFPLQMLCFTLCFVGNIYAADVSLSNTIVGSTPEIVGHNAAHFMLSSNTET